MASAATTMVKFGLPLIAPPNARLFILGSLPGDASLAVRCYYAHPTNQFWRLLEQALGENLGAVSYEERLATLARRRIGLWDVIASANRRGSLDQSIRGAEPNPLDRLLDEFPHVRAIAFNGAAAASAGRRLISVRPGLTLIDLPSSSAANTRPFAQKVAAWAALTKYAAPEHLPEAASAPQ
ncbi:MAG: DNA-deoxyinosine glycosylase [Sphingomicrobium sp.]